MAITSLRYAYSWVPHRWLCQAEQVNGDSAPSLSNVGRLHVLLCLVLDMGEQVTVTLQQIRILTMSRCEGSSRCGKQALRECMYVNNIAEDMIWFFVRRCAVKLRVLPTFLPEDR
jgi:hypothetical protein